MRQTWLPKLLHDLSPARRPVRKAARRRAVQTRVESLEDRNLLSASSALTASITSAPPFSPNGDGVQDTTAIQLHYSGASTHVTQLGIAVENQAAQVIYQAPQVTAGSASGNLTFTWDGKGTNGKVVAGGTYTVVPVLNGSLFINPAAVTVDTTAPTVTATAPANNGFARGNVTLSATAADADGVTRVDFYVDGSATPAGHGTYNATTKTWNFTLATAAHNGGLADGDHTWYAKATDTAGNSAASATQTLHVDNTGPKVSVTSPGVGVLGETQYTLAGTAADLPALPGYGVASVQVTVTSAADGTVLSTGPATLTPAAGGGTTWSYAYTPKQAGVEVVTARATDQAGNTGASAARFTVDHRPVVTLPAAATANEGAILSASGSFADPDGTNPADSWKATVDYGDGSRVQKLTLNADKTFTLNHAYADNGTYTVTVKVTDKYGVTGTATLTATVANVAPSNLTLTPHPAVVKEGGSVNLAGTFADPGTNDGHTVTVHWGDGSADTTLSLAPGVLTFHTTHPYPRSGTDSVTVTVTDKDGGTASGGTTVAVQNVAPVPTIHVTPGSTPAQEGTPITMGGTVVDPGPFDNFDYQWAVTRNGSPFALPAGTVTDEPGFTFTPTDEGHYVVTLQVTDSDGGVGATSTALNAADVPPTLAVTGAGQVNEGSPYTLTLGAVNDVSPGGVTQYAVHWGDGTTDVYNAAHPLPAGGVLRHTYADGTKAEQITVDVKDEDGNHPAVASQAVTVNNVAPSGTTLQLDHGTISEGGSVTLTGSFADPGTLDTHTATINWGDGSKPDTVNLAAGVLTFTKAHHFLEGGTDSVTVTVADKDGGTNQATATVTVNDVAPGGTTLQLDHATVNEGGTVNLAGSFTDPGTLDAHTVAIDWGDGSKPDTVSLAAGVTTFAKGHQYQDNKPGNAPYTITATVTDTTDKGTDQATTPVTVLNVAPTVTLTGAVASSPEGTAISLGSTVTDPGPADVAAGYTYAWSVTKNGSPYAAGTGTGLAFTPDDDGSYVATLTVTDKDGGVGTVSKTIAVTDLTPTVSIAGPVTGTAGQALAFQGSFTDGPADSQAETFAWKVTTPTGQVVQTGNQQNFSVTLTTPGSYLVSFRVTNADGDTVVTAKPLTIVAATPGNSSSTAPTGGTPVNPDSGGLSDGLSNPLSSSLFV